MKNLRQPSPFRLWGLLASQPGSDSLVDWISDAFFQRIQQLAELGKSLAQIVDQHTRHTSPHQGHHITPCTRRYISIVHSKFAAHIKICGALAHLLFARSCQLQSTMKRHLGRQVCVTVKFALPSSLRYRQVCVTVIHQASTRDCKPMRNHHHLSFHNLQTTQVHIVCHALLLCCLKVLSRLTVVAWACKGCHSVCSLHWSLRCRHIDALTLQCTA